MRTPTMDSDYSYPVHTLGMATGTVPDEVNDVVRQLHAVVEEVTGKPVETPEKPRIGFLP